MVSELEQKYGIQIKAVLDNNNPFKTVLDNNNPYTQVQDLTPKKVLQPNVNNYYGPSQELKPLPKADSKSLIDNTKFFVEKGIIQPAKQTIRNIANLPSAITYTNKKVQDSSRFTQENESLYEQQTENYLDIYKSVQQSMESMHDYDDMPENTKNAYRETVNTVISLESYGKTFEEQRQIIQNMYQDKPLPDFVQKRIENINSKETEYNLKLENARQNLLELAQKNASEIQGIEEKYKDSEIGQATRFSSDIMGSIVQMSPYIAVSAITGGLGGATLGSIAGTGTMYATAYTSSMSKALSEGATREQATDYANMSALIEAGTELISGGIPGAPKGLLSTGIQGKIDDAVKVAVKDGTFRKFISTGVDVFGEGFEEMAAEYLGSMALSIYTEDERTMGELNADAVKAFIMGSVTSGTLQLAKYQTLKVAEKFVAEKSVDIQSLSIEEANKLMNQIALRTGVTSFDGLSYKLEDMPKGQNGYIVNGKEIVLNKAQVEESGLIESALPHEMTHALERVKGYQDLANFVMNLKAQSVGMDLAQLQEVYQEKYNEIHEQELANGNTSHQLEIATQDKMARELVAEFIKNNIASRPYKNANGEIQLDSNGNIITYRDYNALLKLASNQPNSIGKIKKVIRSFIRKGQIAEAQEFDETDKANFLMMQEYLENMDSYLSKVLDNADKGLFATEQAQGLQFDTKSLSRNTEQGVKVIQAYESENGEYKGTLEDAQKLLDYSARKGLGFNEVQYEGGTLVRPSNIQLSLDQLKKNDIDVNEVKNVTVEQQEFFKESKVRDEQGNLIEMYHGTPKGNFKEFKPGSYFTSNKEYAERYKNPNASSISVKKGELNPELYTVYLNIKKPFDTRNKKERDIFLKEFYRKYGTGTPLSEKGLPDWTDGMDLQEFIEEQEYDYDGLILDEGATGGYGEEVVSRGISYVVFNPNQVKEVTNLNPTSSPDIRYSLDNSLVSQLNLSTLIPLIEQSKQSASDYINSLNIQSDNPNVIKYLETMSNFVRDYNPDLRTDTLGNLTTQSQEDDFNLRENGKLKVFYLSDNSFDKNAINYGYILTSNPLGIDNAKQVYVSLRKPLYDIIEGSMQEFNFVLGKDIQKVIDVFNSKGNNLVLDTDELTNAEILKAIGDELGSVDKIKEFYKILNEVTGYDGIEITSSRQIILFNESQFGEAKVKGEYSEQAKKEVKTINFKKSGTEYLVRMTNFNGVEETRVLSKENVIEVLGDDFAKVVLNATNQEQSYDVVENIISKPSNKTKQGIFSQERDDHDNQLTEEVVKFNSESSIKQKDGTLKVMYHGSPNRFEEFSYLNLGTTGAQEGIGIYFTDSPLQASQYTRNEQGMVYEVYLNIKNPTNKTKNTITKEQLKQIVLDIHNSEDNEFLYNYGDISREGLDIVANKAVNIILESNRNNVDIIDTVLLDSRIDTEQGLRIVNQYTGIDGYTLNTSDGVVAIAFFPEQIKSINNPNPTSDRRIQYSIELDSVKQQQIEQAKLNSTNNFSDARSILNDGTLTTSDSVPLESVLINPLYNQAIINKTPTKAQKEQLQAFYLDTLSRSGDTVYLELHDGDRVAYLKYPVVSDLDVVNSDIAKFYQDDSQRKEFFKDSKVRDEQGNLIKLYHGTSVDFTQFDYSKMGKKGKAYGYGFYFTDDPGYAYEHGNKIVRTYLNLTNPVSDKSSLIDKETTIKLIEKFFDVIKYEFENPRAKLPDIDRFYNSSRFDDLYDMGIISQLIQSTGIDVEKGLKIVNELTGIDGFIVDKGGRYGNIYVAFFPEQIKDIENIAPTLSPDIRYSIEYDKNIYSPSLTDTEIKELNVLKSMDNKFGILEGDPDYKRFTELLEKEKNLIMFKNVLNIKEFDDVAKQYRKAKKEFNDDKSVYNKQVLNQIMSFIKGYRDTGRRSKQQWLEISKQYGSQVKFNSEEDLIEQAIFTWLSLSPNNKNNLNRQGSSFVKFGIEEWIKEMAIGAGAGSTKLANVVIAEKEAPIQPIKTIEDERIATRSFQESVLKTELTNQTTESIEKKIADGTFNYVVVSDKQSVDRAIAEIGEDVDKAYNKFKAKIDSGLRMTKDDLVIGQLLIKKLEKSRQTEKVVSLVQDVALLGTELGQQVQALHLIKRMSAEGKLMMMQKTLTRLQDSVNSSKDRNAPRVQLEIPKEYQEFFVEVGARTQELEEQRVQLDNLNQELVSPENSDRIKELESQIAKLEEQIKSNERFTSKENVDDILDEVKSKIAEQLPVTWKDKLDAWRYMSMLGNLRTNVRNVLGNAFVMPMTFSRDVLSVALQQFLPQEQRTRVLRSSKEAENFALNDYLTVGKDIMEGTQKYDMKTDIERKRRIFKSSILEGFREGTFKALEVGDTVFTKKHYITQMAKYLTAQNIDLNTITDEQLENARDFAIKEAEKNTFKQGSDLANALNRIERKGGVAGTIVKAVIPFKKTPINILKMGLEYSPLGVLNGIKKMAFDVKSGKVTAAQAIDTLSAGLTGTGIALLGATLYGMGFIEIGADDDETKRVYNYKNSLGRQRYSIQIGEGSYSIDWIAPAIMPFIMGAEMMRAFESDTEASLLDSLYDATLDIFDPVFELTMLQGVTDTLQSYSGSGAAMFGETLTTMGSNYINQFVPTLLGQIARTVDPIQRSTLPDAKGSLSSTLETTFRKIGNKIPYVSMWNAPVIDVKGQPISSDENPFMRAFMNLVSPGYYKTDNTTEIDQEILRLYELTENTNVLPKATPKSFQFGGETYKLGNKEYSDFGIVMGEKSYQLLGKLTRYDLDDETKVKVMDNLYDYAYQLAKDKYLRTKGLENDDASYKKVIEAELKGIPTLDYLIAKYTFSTMSGEDKKENFQNFLDENGFDNDLMEIVGGYKPSSSKLKTKGLKKLK